MNFKSLKKCSLLLLLMVITPYLSKNIYAQTICPDPDKPCGSFKPYELPFKIPPSRALARAEDRSAEFYAVILKTAKPCAISEDERQLAQRQFPRDKVFVSRFECEPEHAVTYSTLDHRKHSILAVYAGATKRGAATFLNQVRQTGRFPDAYIKKTTVILVHP